MIDIVLVEDQVMLRDSLTVALNAQPDMRVVAALGNAGLAAEAVRKHGAGLALLDVCTEDGASGIAAARSIKQAFPQVKVVVMTGMPELTFLEQARQAGADSFIYKNVGTAELAGVIRSTFEGYSTYPNARGGTIAGGAALSPVEIDILRLVCEGSSRKEIAAKLYLSEGTVKRHISEILAKTGYDNILRLAVHAVSEGYIAPRMAPER